MEDNLARWAVFCTADIPTTILESFLEDSEESQFELLDEKDFDPSKWLVLMTSNDLSTIHHGMSSPVQPFTSPFIGQTIEEVVAWFQQNILEPNAKGYDSSGFIVFDYESLEEEVCTIVSLNVSEETDEPYETVRCDFTIAVAITNVVAIGRDLDDAGARCFMNSGVIMTKERAKIVFDGGMYLDGMEVKYDEFWKEFIRKWS